MGVKGLRQKWNAKRSPPSETGPIGFNVNVREGKIVEGYL